MSKKVLITAGASGIGKAMATAFNKKDYDIWIVDPYNNNNTGIGNLSESRALLVSRTRPSSLPAERYASQTTYTS